FGPLDFKPKSLQDGWGDDWPITYDDVAPYYDKTEQLIGVTGTSEEVFNSSAGKNLLPPFRPRCGEFLIKKGAEKLGIKAVARSIAVLSRPYDGRPACHYCGACGDGCDTRSRYSALEVVIPKLQGLRNFTLRTNAAVHTVLMDPGRGKARGVTYIDTQNKQEYEEDAPDWTYKRLLIQVPVLGLPNISDEAKKHEYPIELGPPREISIHWKIELPAGYTPKLLPPMALSRGFADYRSVYAFKDGTLMLERRLV